MSETVAQQLGLLHDLLSISPPPFVYVHEPHGVIPPAASAIHQSLASSSSVQPIIIDVFECLSYKLFYTRTINQLSDWTPSINDKGKGYAWPDPKSTKWDMSWDAFVGALKASYSERFGDVGGDETSLVLLICHAEGLGVNLSDIIVPLARLRELSSLPVSVVFFSVAPFSELGLTPGSCPDPLHFTLLEQSKTEILAELNSRYPSSSKIQLYHPCLKPLYASLLSVLYDSCVSYTRDPEEIQYMAYAMWPTFIRPVMEDWKATGIQEPPEETAVPILVRHFTSTFVVSFRDLHSRAISAKAFLRSQAAQPSFRLSERFPKHGQASSSRAGKVDEVLLPTKERLLLVAAYICSYNPPRTDLRMFGRIAEGSSRKSRKPRANAAANRASKAAKIPQGQLGPNNFTLERLIAVYGALVLEHGDGEIDLAALKPGDIETNIHRVGILMTVTDLVQRRLLHRVGSGDKIDGNVSLKCNIDMETAERYAKDKDLNFNLAELLWDPAI